MEWLNGLNSKLDLLGSKNLFSTISSNLEFIKLEHSCLLTDEIEEIFVKNELKRFTMLSLVSAVLIPSVSRAGHIISSIKVPIWIIFSITSDFIFLLHLARLFVEKMIGSQLFLSLFKIKSFSEITLDREKRNLWIVIMHSPCLWVGRKALKKLIFHFVRYVNKLVYNCIA